jgi:5-methylcytosine-specific restriction enzyme A
VHGVRVRYGADLARDYIEVHHTRSIAEIDGGVVSPETDLAPLCSNCHSMVHRERGRVIALEELRVMIVAARKAKAANG